MTAYESTQSRVNQLQAGSLASDRGGQAAALRRASGANLMKNTGMMSLGLNSPKGMAVDYESMPAFAINTAKGIPDKSSIRTMNTSRNRMDSLMKVPMHKQGTSKFDKSTHARSIAPLTSEDIHQFNNLSLMGTLRSM